MEGDTTGKLAMEHCYLSLPAASLVLPSEHTDIQRQNSSANVPFWFLYGAFINCGDNSQRCNRQAWRVSQLERLLALQKPFPLLAPLSLDGEEMESILLHGGICHLIYFPQFKITNHYYTFSCNFAHGKMKKISYKGTIF